MPGAARQFSVFVPAFRVPGKCRKWRGKNIARNTAEESFIGETASVPDSDNHVGSRGGMLQYDRCRYASSGWAITWNATPQFSTPHCTFLALAAAMPLNLLRSLPET